VFKLRILAGVLLVLLAGCTTASRRSGRGDYIEAPANEVKTPIETEHITEAPSLAPPPAGSSQAVHAPTNHLASLWIPLRRWAEENKAGPVQGISGGRVPAFALKAENGLLIVRAYDQVAYWNGMEFHLGFAPQVVNGQPMLNSLDLEKNIAPLLHPWTLPEETNRVVVIDPGHGGSNLGTRSTVDGAYEKEFALDWAKRLAPILATNGWKVFLTRTSDIDMSLSNRVDFADAHKADLFVSLHFNADPTPTNPDQGGIETFCVTPTGMPSTLKRDFEDDASLVFPNNRFDVENFQYAMRFQRSLLKVSGAKDHGVRRARFMTVLRGQNRPAVLIEGGYLSDPREARRIADPAYRQKLAEAVAAALMDKSAVHTSGAVTAEATVQPAVQNKAPFTNSASEP
jgi:N-acetylmuramoyl-L-alanine amidase